MLPIKTCISCHSAQLSLNCGVLTCGACDLRMAMEMHILDYKSAYCEDASLYGDHLKSLFRFQKSHNPLIGLLPFENEIISELSTARNVNTIVDLGCGTGRFLRAIESTGFNAIGFEVATILVKELSNHGRNVHQGGIDEFLNSNLQADVVTLLEVVEHLEDPGTNIKNILINKNPKQLFVVVPDWETRRRFDSRFAAHDVPPNHLSWWNQRSLEILLGVEEYEVRVEKIPECRRSLLGHFARNGYKTGTTGVVDWLRALAVPPSFWLLGIAERK